MKHQARAVSDKAHSKRAAALPEHCPTPYKAAFLTRKDAKRYLRYNPRIVGKRAYRCPCGAFHLGSMPKGGSREVARTISEGKLA